MMYGRTALLLNIAWLGASSAAIACEVIEKSADKPWLESHKPVLAEAAALSTAFGMRHHPLLNEQRMHTGVDWSATLGTPVMAVSPGRVLEVGRKGMHGNIVLVEHGAGWRTLYAHLSSFDANVGDCVKSGEVIGKVGKTGLTSGPVLHFEILQYGWSIDPMSVPTQTQAAGPGGR